MTDIIKITDVTFTDEGKNKLSMIVTGDDKVYCLKYKPKQEWIIRELLLKIDTLFFYDIRKFGSNTYIVKIRNCRDWEVRMFFYDDVYDSNSGIWYSIKQGRSLFSHKHHL